MEENKSLAVIDAAKEKFVAACKNAQSLQIVNNFGGAFAAANVVKMLRDALTKEVMNEVFMPLMNTKVGFLTDRTGKTDRNGRTQPLYTWEEVRDCVIDAVAIGLLPTGNQFNILAGRMYPTKEGYTALLRKIQCKNFITIGAPKMDESTADVECIINYEYNGEKNSFKVIANVKKDSYSSMDQIKGKAERRAKKVLYEYLTGIDFGDGDETSTTPEDVEYTDVSEEVAEEVSTKANQTKISIEPVKPMAPKATPSWAKSNE